MVCLRFDFRYKMTAYIHGKLNQDSICKMEIHLANCEHCREHVEKFIRTDRLMHQLPSHTAPVHVWQKLEAALQGRQQGFHRREVRPWSIAAAAVVIMLSLIIWNSAHHVPQSEAVASFRQVPISEFSRAKESNIATEGYVSDIQIDEDDGDVTFKLVDNIHRPEHFIVCEIIPAIKIRPPAAGSRIRVFGINRFDDEENHQWYEIHPVLNIQPVD